MVDEIEQQIECALQSGDFECSRFLLSQYRDRVEAELQRAVLGRESLIQHSLELSQRWLILSRVARCHIADELRYAACEDSYSKAEGSSPILEFIG